jgi:hypothetical protein
MDFKGAQFPLILENSLETNGFVKRVQKYPKPCDFRNKLENNLFCRKESNFHVCIP